MIRHALPFAVPTATLDMQSPATDARLNRQKKTHRASPDYSRPTRPSWQAAEEVNPPHRDQPSEGGGLYRRGGAKTESRQRDVEGKNRKSRTTDALNTRREKRHRHPIFNHATQGFSPAMPIGTPPLTNTTKQITSIYLVDRRIRKPTNTPLGASSREWMPH